MTEVKIGPHTYSVVCVDSDLLEDAGSCCVESLLIRIRDDLALGAKRETLLHEALHAMLAQTGVALPHKLEEAVVTGLAPLLLGFLQDNPGILKGE